MCLMASVCLEASVLLNIYGFSVYRFSVSPITKHPVPSSCLPYPNPEGNCMRISCLGRRRGNESIDRIHYFILKRQERMFVPCVGKCYYLLIRKYIFPDVKTSSILILKFLAC